MQDLQSVGEASWDETDLGEVDLEADCVPLHLSISLLSACLSMGAMHLSFPKRKDLFHKGNLGDDLANGTS